MLRTYKALLKKDKLKWVEEVPDNFTRNNEAVVFVTILDGDESEKVLVVLPQGIDHNTTSKLWDNVNLTDLEDDVVNCLQLIDPNIEKVALVGSWGGENVPEFQ
jgi:hypothetical protein